MRFGVNANGGLTIAAVAGRTERAPSSPAQIGGLKCSLMFSSTAGGGAR
jgi:hypothetical protein